ncbi:MAG TPA: DNA polymerase II, partial [Halieaceae bacterium]|nr:DNA polymerase II [Halieaceae bacterium]
MPSAPVQQPVELGGFLLTRQWRDSPAGLLVELWFATPQGPVQVEIRGERAVFFLAEDEANQHRALLALQPGVELKSLRLRNFALQPVVGVYSPTYRQSRALADRLQERGAQPLEADINPADRYLMERFIAGGVQLHGPLERCNGYSRMRDPLLRSAT